jgi:signal peptidase II
MNSSFFTPRKKIALILILLLVIDQVVKFVVKLNMTDGQSISVFGDWFYIHFIENPGAAFGFRLGDGSGGKLFLSLFRIVAIAALIWYLNSLIKKKAPMGVLVGIGLVLAGAIGNMIDSAFYGLIFDKGTVFNAEFGQYVGYSGLAELSGNGYERFLHGCVVDMLHFPIIDTTWPEWVPWVGGDSLRFFSPIFNVADSYITIAVIYMLLFQRKYFIADSKK